MLDTDQNLRPGQEDEQDQYLTENRQKLDKNQKIALAVLGIFSFVIVYMWFAQFENNLTGAKNQAAQNSTSSSNSNGDLELKTKDTDGDGLTDWEELNLYGTSPYLEDSDSDGLSDKNEIDRNSDPNCPEGQKCTDVSAGGESDLMKEDASTNNQDIVDLQDVYNNLNQISDAAASAELAQSAASSSATSEINSLLNGQADAATLRKFLLEYGMDQKVLDQFSDDELQQVFKETMSNQTKQ